MENDNLKNIFDSFDPELSSDSQFITKLQSKLRAIEEVKNEVSSLRRRNRLSLMAASFAGFIAGVVMALLFPAIFSAVSLMAEMIGLSKCAGASTFQYVLSWGFAAGATILVAYSSYGFAYKRLKG